MKGSMKKACVVFGAVMLTAASAYCEEIKVGGGGASIASVFNPIKPYYEKATGDTLVILQATSKDGLINLSKGKVDITTGAVPLEAMLAGAEKDGVNIDRSTLVSQEIAKNRTVLFVHPSNKVSKLSKEQLKGIFSGKTTNWKDVGGDDKDIIIVWSTATSGQNNMFKQIVMDGEQVTKEVMDSTNYAKIKESIASTPEAIGIDPFSLADDTVKVLDTPPMAEPIIAITVGKPTAKVQRLLNYIKGDGNKYVKQ